MATRRPFRTRVFLLRTLVMIFVVQLGLLVFSFNKCSSIAESREITPQEVCPNLADKSEKLFTVTIATVLSLLVGKEET